MAAVCAQGGKIAVHGSPQVQLPISCYGTMDSSRHYDKMVKQKELIEANTHLLHKKQEFTSKMSDISKKKVASKQKWDKVGSCKGCSHIDEALHVARNVDKRTI